MNIKYLREKEVNELCQVLREDDTRNGLRNRAIILLAKYCALRVSEVGMLKLDDYMEERGEIYCTREKNSYNNTIRIIDPEVKKVFDYYLIQRKKYYKSKTPYIFISQMGTPISRKTLDHIFKMYCAKTEIPMDRRHFHCLKHTRAIELANSGLDIKEVQWWLGHKNINNTLIYMQFTTRQQDTLYSKLEGIENHDRKNLSNDDYGIPDEEDTGYLFT